MWLPLSRWINYSSEKIGSMNPISLILSLKTEKFGCYYEMNFFNHHLQIWYINPIRMALSLNRKSVVASMRWNSIFIICKISGFTNDSIPEIRKLWLPLWDEILYSSSAEYQYQRMAMSLKSEKCGCLYVEILYSSSAKFQYTRKAMSLNSEKCGCLWVEILYSSSAKFQYTRMTLTLALKSKKCDCLYEIVSLFIICKIGVYESYIRMTLVM